MVAGTQGTERNYHVDFVGAVPHCRGRLRDARDGARVAVREAHDRAYRYRGATERVRSRRHPPAGDAYRRETVLRCFGAQRLDLGSTGIGSQQRVVDERCQVSVALGGRHEEHISGSAALSARSNRGELRAKHPADGSARGCYTLNMAQPTKMVQPTHASASTSAGARLPIPAPSAEAPPPSDPLAAREDGDRARALVDRHIRALRFGVWCLFTLRAVLTGLGVGALVFALVAIAVGPACSAGAAAVAWGVVAIGGGAAAAFGAYAARAYRGLKVTALLEKVAPSLVSQTRSVMGFVASEEHLAGASRALIDAHARRVAAELTPLEARRLWPWRALWRGPAPAVALFSLLCALAVFALVEVAPAGAYALTHPGARREGIGMANVVAELRAELRYPSYLELPDATVENVEVLRVPLGTTVTMAMRPRIPLTEAVLRAPGQSASFARADGGWWRASFVLREGGRLQLDVRDQERHALRDARARSVAIERDEAPEVTLVNPATDLVVGLEESVAIAFDVEDDFGLTSTELCLRTVSGEVVRRPLERFEQPVPSHRGRTGIAPAELGARPGDRFSLWIEAADADDVSGPNIGRSAERVIEIASEATEREELQVKLEEVLDAALFTLAARLEWIAQRRSALAAEADPSETDAADPHAAIEASSDIYARRLESFASSPTRDFDGSVIATMRRRFRQAHAQELRVQQDPAAPRRAAIALLEEHTLFLADALGMAKLQDASAIARELEALRREMRSLLDELRRTDSPEARRDLMTTLARAQARLRELESRLASLGEDVPREFVNVEALEREMPQTHDALAKLAQAMESNDLDAAERALTRLEQQIDAMAKSLGEAGEAFGEARFGPRQRAMADALDRLAGVEAEQRQLAERTESVRRHAAERALGEAGPDARAAAREVESETLRSLRALSQLPGGALSPSDEDTLGRARQRLEDTADALRNGDLGEARRMAAESQRETDRLARDLEISAMMFPGRQGRTAEAARRAREASRGVEAMGRSLDDALPRIADYVQDAQQRQMRADAQRQGEARAVAESLAEAFGAEPDGAPLSPDGVAAMERAAEAMKKATQTLRRGRPLDAARAQQQAARELTELREKLEQQSQSEGSGGDSSTEGAMSARPRVAIPRDETDADTNARRRKILDAMRDDAPEGYEAAVRRYYEELLR